jgi:ketosteroid isomerase-like protein
MRNLTMSLAVATAGILATTAGAQTSRSADSAAVAALDVRYQAAVKANDAAAMGGILADDFALVTGRGTAYSKADLLKAATNKDVLYERQDDTLRTVRVWGNTAVITARLWIKGTTGGQAIDYLLWFSDTYVKMPDGWRYVFGQASLHLPASP